MSDNSETNIVNAFAAKLARPDFLAAVAANLPLALQQFNKTNRASVP